MFSMHNAMNCFAAINADTSLWNDPRLAAAIAASGVGLLLATIWLMRRKSRDGRGAAAICLCLSVVLHGVLIYFLPVLRSWGGGAASDPQGELESGISAVTIADFNPDFEAADASTESQLPDPNSKTLIAPLPLSEPAPIPAEQVTAPLDEKVEAKSTEDHADLPETLPSTLVTSAMAASALSEEPTVIDDLLSDWLSDDANKVTDQQAGNSRQEAHAASSQQSHDRDQYDRSRSPAGSSGATAAHVPGMEQNDFGQRTGNAKRLALLSTGGDDSTEAAVEAALQFLAADQRPDGAWDPATSGAGRETQTLGTDRGGAGKRATNGITGLALLSMLGAGHTHLEGTYASNVHRGLSYLIRSQQPDGSLAGPATTYEATYCHGMAALAMCEAAAITGDESAIRSAAAAVQFTLSSQHPTTGGWRYTKGDRGDLSQLGWQAMVLDGGRRAAIPVTSQSLSGMANFLRSVRSGQNGGLASYRPGEAPTRTMTAEALATRLLLGETIPQNEIAEAEAYLLRQPPGVGKDNYYGWYYTSLALHQLQDDAWQRWNAAMKSHLVARQMPNGSWPTDDEWGGYGGRVYTTATATLCLEVYYRHAIRRNILASDSGAQPTIR